MKIDTSDNTKNATRAPIRHFRELNVYQMAMQTAMTVFEESKTFPPEERHSLTGPIRRASRSVCANIAEAWRKRLYPKAFIGKLSDAEISAAETQVWIEFAQRCAYLSDDRAKELEACYDRILGKIVTMLNHPEKWIKKR
jgi:four helix bundle protein